MKMDWTPLVEWFVEQKRSLPWREEISPYRVWVSEVMLQQTRASVVIPYFERWMQRFPTLEDFAYASLAEVMKLWEGLGYYARVRFLHEGAKKVVQEFQGDVPNSAEKLSTIKGLGPYTKGAILSFAFHQRAAAVDGNVIRVVSRLFCRKEGVEQKRFYHELVEACLPEEEPWMVMEALIELGALICQKKPKCSLCPLKAQCQGYRQGEAAMLPIRKKGVVVTALEREVRVIVYGEEVLLKQEAVGKVMGGLFEFPYVSKGEEWGFSLKMKKRHTLPKVKHSFTRFKATLYPFVYEAEERGGIAGYVWVAVREVSSLPLSSGHKRIWNYYCTEIV